MLVKTSSGALLNADAAKSYEALNKAFKARFGKDLYITSGARTYQQQVDTFKQNYNPYYTVAEYGRVERRWWDGRWWYRKPWRPTTAQPGTSNHEYPPGKAADFGSGVQVRRSAEHNWMLANAPSYGWEWTGKNFSTIEPWHWEKNFAWSGGNVTPLPEPKPEPKPDEEEEEDMPKNAGFYYTRAKDNKRVYLLVNTGSGWWMEYLSTTTVPQNSHTPIATTLETGTYVQVSESWANAMKASLSRVNNVTGTITVAGDEAAA